MRNEPVHLVQADSSIVQHLLHSLRYSPHRPAEHFAAILHQLPRIYQLNLIHTARQACAVYMMRPAAVAAQMESGKAIQLFITLHQHSPRPVTKKNAGAAIGVVGDFGQGIRA
ncbi:hypothetical protein D3C74_301730 [compost metagenome]